MDAWETLHRWEWFRRRQWLANFRERRHAISTAVAALLRERGLAEGHLLDCSCGLGFHTIAFAEAGLCVSGADQSALAVGRAQELAHREGHAISFFVASWHDLPTCVPQRFDAIFCDALSWIPTRHAFQEALQGLRQALRPGGVLHPRLASYRGGIECTKLSVGTLGQEPLR